MGAAMSRWKGTAVGCADAPTWCARTVLWLVFVFRCETRAGNTECGRRWYLTLGLRRHLTSRALCSPRRLYFGVGLGLMQSAVAASSEGTYQAHFGAWVDVRVRCVLPVFFQHCRDSMINSWELFEYVAYAFAIS